MRLTQIRRSFSATASRVAAARLSGAEQDSPTAATPFQYTLRPAEPEAPWLDDVAPVQAALEAHRRSPEYQELHRSHMTNADMGLYGGEKGFEMSPRTWVDPDNPQIKHIFNVTALAKNLRYARYGYFKADLQIIDMDKLLRHARMLPNSNLLLIDVIAQRAPLDDAACGAILMHSFRRMHDLPMEARQAYFREHVEMVFERMLITSIPPVEVGVQAHAAAIRCCALAGRFEEGYYSYRARAVEEANRTAEALMSGTAAPHMQRPEATHPFLLSADFFDAVMELCVGTGRFDVALTELHRAIESGRRLLTDTLDRALIACAYLRRPQDAREVWELYSFYKREPTARSFEYLAACIGRGAAVADAAGATDIGVVSMLPGFFADAFARLSDQQAVKDERSQSGWAIQRLSLEAHAWIFHAWATSERYGRNRGSEICSLLASLATRGDPPTAELLVFVLQYCAARPEDGAETALEVLQLYLRKYQIAPTYEIALLLARAFAMSAAPTPQMLVEALRVVDAVTHTTGDNSAVDVFFGAPEVASDVAAFRRRHCYPVEVDVNEKKYDEMEKRRRDAENAMLMALLTLASRLGASAEAFKLLSQAAMNAASQRRDDGSVWAGAAPFAFNLALVANALAEPGPAASHRVTQEIIELFFATSTGELTKELIEALSLCRRVHGAFPDPLVELLDSTGMPESDVSLLDLVDAQDGFIDLYAKEQPDEVANVKQALASLKSDVEHSRTVSALQPWNADPFVREKQRIDIRFDAKRLTLNMFGEYTRHRKTENRESSREALTQWRPFGHYEKLYKDVD